MTNDKSYVTVTVPRSAIVLTAIFCAVIALGGFVYVAVHELGYASDHPYAYGPAKVIALGAGAGALVALAVALIATTLWPSDSEERTAPPRAPRGHPEESVAPDGHARTFAD